MSSHLLTIRDLAKHTKVRIHRVRYAIDVAGIEPVQRAAGVRLFTLDQISAVEAALEQTKQRGRTSTAEAMAT